MKFKPFKILKDSIVKGARGKYYYCETDPPHPFAEARGDRDKKYIYLHRALMEQKLGRYLRTDEEVNHKDGNPKNNKLSNLEVLNKSDHAQKGECWKKSPRTKPGQDRAAARTVVAQFLTRIYSPNSSSIN